MGINVRDLAVLSLVEMDKNSVFLSKEISAVLDKYDYMDVRDKAFYRRVVSGTIERKIRIDYILGLFSSTKINKMKPYIRSLLRMSVYQIMWMDSIPDSAVCNEAVKLAVAHKFSGLKGFVNGVLRNICRNKDNIKYPDCSKDKFRYMSVIYSCPEWIVKLISDTYSQKICEDILVASMEEHPLSVRLRGDKDEIAELIGGWQDAGISVWDNEYITSGRFINGIEGVANLYGYDEGRFVVQDTGSMLVAKLADISAGDIVMDMCAAPGGKSMHAADILLEKEKQAGCDKPGKVYAYDISQERCDKIIENIERLDIRNIKVIINDATQFIPDMEESADVVIVDAPCSGLGVFGRKSDIKYRVKPEDIDELAQLQRRIIDTAVRYVKPGGRLVYSTCTITEKENIRQAEYIRDELNLKPVRIDEDNEFLQLLPGKDKSDGFFISVFVK